MNKLLSQRSLPDYGMSLIQQQYRTQASYIPRPGGRQRHVRVDCRAKGGLVYRLLIDHCGVLYVMQDVVIEEIGMPAARVHCYDSRIPIR